MYERMLADYDYFVMFTSGPGRTDDLFRSFGPVDEQRYLGDNRWERSSEVDKYNHDRGPYDGVRTVTAAEAEQIRRVVDSRQTEGARHYVVRKNGEPSAVVRVRGDEGLAFTGGPWWGPLDRLGTVHDVEEISWERSLEHMAALILMRQGTSSGGFAVYRNLTDVLDFESAYAVVDELLPEHRYAVPLLRIEADKLAPMIIVREARRRASPVDGHYYFALFEGMRLQDVSDLDLASSVIRCPADGTGTWETFLRDGEWAPGLGVDNRHALPVGRADAERVMRRLEATEVRFFDVRPSGGGRVALIRRTGPVEEAVRDLGWEPVDVLRRWRREPKWRVSEIGRRSFDRNRYIEVTMQRMRARVDGELEYFAIFRDQSQVYDLSTAVAVVRRLHDGDEEFTPPDGWRPVKRRDRTHEREMRLTAEEVRLLTEGPHQAQ